MDPQRFFWTTARSAFDSQPVRRQLPKPCPVSLLEPRKGFSLITYEVPREYDRAYIIVPNLFDGNWTTGARSTVQWSIFSPYAFLANASSRYAYGGIFSGFPGTFSMVFVERKR